MNLSKTLSARLNLVFINGRWITNTNYKELMNGINHDFAICKISGLNSIAEICFHINYYLEGLNNAFSEGQLNIKDKYSFDMKPIKSEADWQLLRETLIDNAKKFIQSVEKMSDNQIIGPFIEEKYGTCLRNIEGVIEHSYYHLGQMVIIKKMINAGYKS